MDVSNTVYNERRNIIDKIDKPEFGVKVTSWFDAIRKR